jgi:hypothetical protein
VNCTINDPLFTQDDNVSAAIEGCVNVRNSSIMQTEPSCLQGYEFKSNRGDWTIVTEVNKNNVH